VRKNSWTSSSNCENAENLINIDEEKDLGAPEVLQKN